jgi:hypothetical protein
VDVESLQVVVILPMAMIIALSTVTKQWWEHIFIHCPVTSQSEAAVLGEGAYSLEVNTAKVF